MITLKKFFFQNHLLFFSDVTNYAQDSVKLCEKLKKNDNVPRVTSVKVEMRGKKQVFFENKVLIVSL